MSYRILRKKAKIDEPKVMLCNNSFLVFLSILTHLKLYSSSVGSGATVGRKEGSGERGL